jgi:Tol biopolymer transport system component
MIRLLVRVLLTLTILHGVLLGIALAAGHLDSAPRRELAYYIHRHGRGRVVLLDVNRSLAVTLLRHDPYVVSLAWSPDGETLAFIAYDNIGVYRPYLLNITNRKLQSPDRQTSSNEAILWSPDGRRIAFNSYVGPHPSIHVIDTQTLDVSQLVIDNILWNGEPSWSPDGAELAFTGRGQSIAVYAIPAECLQNDCGPRLLVDHPATDRRPAWSPVDGQIAFVSDRRGQSAIYVTAAGQEPRYIASLNFGSTSLAWSPDGRRLAFTDAPRTVGSAIYIADLDSSRIHLITASNEVHASPNWSSDGRMLAFVSRRINRSAIAVMDLSCLEQPIGCQGHSHQFVERDSHVWSPAWRPG